MKLSYRPEIDGLRAVAVLPVILFHAGFELFSGGFVGVDVFFVISGYLITTIIIEDIESQRFSLINFYERRARRILPALFFVMLVCIPFAWMWMLPSQMKDFSQSLVAVSLFASNVLFLKESGYFDATAEEKPLLHTWSLAVEEQYYVLFPILLILAWRFGKGKVFWTIVIMAALSLLLSEWGWRNKPNANFYLAPTRAWELFFGSISAFIVQKNGVKKNNFLALFGLAAILFSVLVYDKSIPFPSVYALMPILGTLLLILYAEQKTIVAKLLSTKLFVGIGLISYSAYLWHQPIFAFYKIVSYEQHKIVFLFMLPVIFVLAFLSWRYIEKPFRERRVFSSRSQIFTASILFIFGFVLLGVFGHFNNELRPSPRALLSQLHPHGEKHNILCHERFPQFDDFLACNLSKDEDPDILLVGDSHSYHYYAALAETMPAHAIMNVSETSCLPFATKSIVAVGLCRDKQLLIKEMIHSSESLKVIILSGYWTYLASGGFEYQDDNFRIAKDITDETSASYLDNAYALLDAISQRDVKIFILQDVPELNFNIQSCFNVGRFRFPIRNECFVKYDDYLLRAQHSIHLIEALRNVSPKIQIWDPKTVLCQENSCKIKSVDGYPLYRDGDHLSPAGAQLIMNRFVDEYRLK